MEGPQTSKEPPLRAGRGILGAASGGGERFVFLRPTALFVLAILAGTAYRLRHFRDFAFFYSDDATVADFARILANTWNLGQSMLHPGAVLLLGMVFKLTGGARAMIPPLVYSLLGVAVVVLAGLLARSLYSSKAAGALAAALMAGSFWAQFYSKVHVAAAVAFFLLGVLLYVRARESGRLVELAGAGLAVGAAFTAHYIASIYAASLAAFELTAALLAREPWRVAARRLLLFSCFLALPPLLVEAYVHLRWSVSGQSDPVNALYLARVVKQMVVNLHSQPRNYPRWFFPRLFLAYEGVTGALVLLGALMALLTALLRKSRKGLLAPFLFVVPVALWLAHASAHAVTPPRAFSIALPFGAVALAGLGAIWLERRPAVLAILVLLALTDGYFKYRAMQQGHTGIDAAVRSVSYVPGTVVLFQGSARTAHFYFRYDALVFDNPFYLEQVLADRRARYLITSELFPSNLQWIEPLLAKYQPLAIRRDFPSPRETFLPIVAEANPLGGDVLFKMLRENPPIPFVRVYFLQP